MATHVKIIKDAASLENLPPPPEVVVESPVTDAAPIETPSEISSPVKEGEEEEDASEEVVEKNTILPPPSPEAASPAEVALASKTVENDEDGEQPLEQHEVYPLTLPY